MEKSKSPLGSLTVQIIIGMLLGIFVGLYLGRGIPALALAGTLLIQLIKAFAVPLVFASIFEAFVSTNISWKSARSLLLVVGINSCCAVTIALTLSNFVKPGSNLDFRRESQALHLKDEHSITGEGPAKELSAIEVLVSHIPKSMVEPFAENNIIGVVLLALLIGSAARQLITKPDEFGLETGARFLMRLFTKILSWLIRLTPIAVFGVTAKTVGEYGLAPFHALTLYVGVILVGFIVHMVVVYHTWIVLIAKIPLKKFLSSAKDTLFYAFGTNSSLATLPLTLETLDELEVPKAASRLGACIGTNLNNDGIILYESMAVLFVAQAYGIDLSLSEQLSAVVLCLFAAVGVAGVPEAGIISLSLVLAAVKLPLEILPLLLTVDWLIARGRSVMNVLADMTVSIAIGKVTQR